MAEASKKRLGIRITDSGAISAVTLTTNTLLQISVLLSTGKTKTVEELALRLKEQLRKYLRWLERVPDGTLYNSGMSRKELNALKFDAEKMLDWHIVPSEQEYAERARRLETFREMEEQREELAEKRVAVMMDTSFLLSYLSKTDGNAQSTNVLVSYLKTQRKFFDLYLPNLVLLELIARLKQQHSFKKARKTFDDLLEDITQSRIALNEGKLSIYEIFERYEKFAKHKLSSSLRGNDFLIATDGIAARAMILTCDRKMAVGIKKTYKDVYLITQEASSYMPFFGAFERKKKTLE